MTAFQPRWLTPVPEKALEQSRVEQIAGFINIFGTQTKDTVAGKSGSPLQLRDWQVDLLRHIFAVNDDGLLRHRTSLVGMPRKNGKSALGSGVALWSLFLGADGGEVYSCAADKEQARIVFADAKKTIEQHPELNEMCRLYRDAVEVTTTGSIYRVLSSEAFTKEGLSPTFVVFDELHATPNRELWETMRLGMGARREPMMFAITTAGVKSDNTGQDSTAYDLYQYGQKVARGEIKDDKFFMAWWEAAAEADHYDPETWRIANPGFGDLNDPQDFEAMVKSTPEAEFRTKRCNQWVSSQNAWLPNGSWEQLGEPEELNPDDEYVLGVDGSFSNDCSAIVGCRIPRNEDDVPYVFLVKAWEKQPTDRDDWRVDTLEVENTVIDFCAKFPGVREICFDPFRWQRTMAVLLERGLPLIEWNTTSARRMVPACKKFYDAVVEQKVRHDGNPLLTRHLSNAVVKTDNLGPRIVKESRNSPRKIDAAVAGIIALDRATVRHEPEETIIPKFYI